jgi:hypothetical protein
VLRAAIVLEPNLTVECALLVGASAPVQACLSTQWYPALAGAALLAVPLIHVSGGGGVTVQPRQPPIVRLPTDPVSNLIIHEVIVYDRSLAWQVNCQPKAV